MIAAVVVLLLAAPALEPLSAPEGAPTTPPASTAPATVAPAATEPAAPASTSPATDATAADATTPDVTAREPTAPPLTLDEVLRQVRAHHPSIAIAAAEQTLVGGDLMAAEGAFDPVLRGKGWAERGTYDNDNLLVGLDVPTPLWGATFNGDYRIGRGKIPSYEKYDETDPLGEVSAGVTLPLWRNGPVDRRRATIARLALEQTIAEQGIDAVLLDLQRVAALRYWEWVAAGERLQIARGLLRIASDRAVQLSARVAQGDLPEVERLDNERLVAQRQQRVVQARRAVEQAALELSLFLRDAGGAPIVVDSERLPALSLPQTPLPTRDETLALASTRRPEVLRLQAQSGQARVERDFANNQFAPGIDVFGEVTQNLGDGARLGVTDVKGGLSVEIPSLFRAARGRVAAAEAAQTRVEAQRRLLQDRIAIEVDDAWSALRAADERSAFARNEVEAAVAVENAERIRFAAGDSTILQVNLREQAAADARGVAVDAALDAWRARVLLDAATARWLSP